jgi:hypothetical protein
VTSSDVSLRKSGTAMLCRLGDDSDYTQFNAADYFSSSGKMYLAGITSSEVLLKRSGTTLLVRKGDDSNYGSLTCATLTCSTLNYTFGGFNGTGAYTNFSISDGIVISAS